MEMEIEQDGLLVSDDQVGVEVSQTEPARTDPAEVYVISSDIGSNLRRNKSLPRFTREVISLAESFAGATQLISPSDPIPISVDDDSASA
jgi:hypothetical protein